LGLNGYRIKGLEDDREADRLLEERGLPFDATDLRAAGDAYRRLRRVRSWRGDQLRTGGGAGKADEAVKERLLTVRRSRTRSAGVAKLNDVIRRSSTLSTSSFDDPGRTPPGHTSRTSRCFQAVCAET
jgi:hypothetical protein